jgi:hypothetical protein
LVEKPPWQHPWQQFADFAVWRYGHAAMETAAPIPDQIIARIESYDDLLEAFRTRVRELNINYGIADDLAGFATGYLGKLMIRETRNASGKRKTKRHFSAESFDAYMAALGLDLVAVANPAKVERLRAWQDTNSLYRAAPVRADGIPPPVVIKLTRNFMKQIASLGGQARAAKLHAIASEKKRRSLIYAANARRRWDARKQQRAAETAAIMASPLA